MTSSCAIGQSFRLGASSWLPVCMDSLIYTPKMKFRAKSMCLKKKRAFITSPRVTNKTASYNRVGLSLKTTTKCEKRSPSATVRKRRKREAKTRKGNCVKACQMRCAKTGPASGWCSCRQKKLRSELKLVLKLELRRQMIG